MRVCMGAMISTCFGVSVRELRACGNEVFSLCGVDKSLKHIFAADSHREDPQGA